MAHDKLMNMDVAMPRDISGIHHDLAVTKWCPFVRTSSNGVVANRDHAEDGLLTNFSPACRCIASACMAWRWKYELVTVTNDEDFGTQPVTMQTNQGYCGLAGRP